MDEAIADSVRKRLLSAFPEGTFAWVDVLGYGDDLGVEPGGIAVRAFIARAGRSEENWDSRQTVHDFADANSDGVAKLHEGLLPSIAWVDFVPDTPERRAKPYDQTFGPPNFLGKRSDSLDETPGGVSVRTWLGPADLATVDALIMAGIAASRADVMRWALGRIREDPAYAQLQGQAGETGAPA
jgi:hypothetical protein